MAKIPEKFKTSYPPETEQLKRFDEEAIKMAMNKGRYGEFSSFDPTYRMSTRDVIADYLQSLGIASTPQTARKMAEGFTGSPDPTADVADSIGVLDFTPVGLVFGGQEVARDFQSAKGPIDYGLATANALVTGLEAYPLTAAMTKPLGKFLKSIGSKLDKTESIDAGRREFMNKAAKTAAAGTVATGALKVLDDVARPAAREIDEAVNALKKTAPKMKKLSVDGANPSSLIRKNFRNPEEIYDFLENSKVTDEFSGFNFKDYVDEYYQEGETKKEIVESILKDFDNSIENMEIQNWKNDEYGSEIRDNIIDMLKKYKGSD